MSRADKRVHRERVIGTAKDESVRIFAFANTRPAYQIIFSPERPIIILKSRRSATEQHPCAQWEPFSDVVFGAHPNTTHAIYLADTTALSTKPGLEKEELLNGAAVATTLRQLANAVARLNPHNATLVAAGASAHLALKYALVGEKTLGHRDRLVERVLLVCPSSLKELTWLTDAVARMHAVPASSSSSSGRDPHYPKPAVTVLVKGGQEVVATYRKWLSGYADLLSSFTVETDLSPSLFAAVARYAMPPTTEDDTPEGEDGSVVDTRSRYPHPRVYRIDFVLSKASKNVEQFPVLSPLDTLGVDEDLASHDDSDPSEEDEQDAAVEAAHGHSHGCHGHARGDEDDGHCCSGEECANDADGETDEGSSMYVSGVSALQQWKEPVRVMLEGRLVDHPDTGLVGTTEGCVVVEGLAELIAADTALSTLVAEKQRKKKGSACVALATRLLRDADGRTTLKALEVRALSRQEEKRSMTAGAALSDIPLGYNVSAIAHSYGAVLVRGRKCALVRDLTGSDGPPARRGAMFLPHEPLAECTESGLDCAIRALCEACDVSSDNFYCPSYLPPVVFYKQDETDAQGRPLTRCVTLYIALAVSPPPRGAASDAKEDRLDATEPYDWVSYHTALSLLSSPEEKEALQEVMRVLQKASRAGLYTTFAGCGYFGEKVQGGAAASAAAATDVAQVAAPSAVSLDGTVEAMVLLCPGSHSLPSAFATDVQAILGVPHIHTFDAQGSAATLERAAEDAVRAGQTTIAFFLNQEEVDVEYFCDEPLLDVLDRRGLKSRFVTVLTPAACDALADLNADDGTARAALMEELRDAARVSDVLTLAVRPPFSSQVARRPLEAEQALWAVLACCTAVNPDLTILRDWQGGGSGGARISAGEIEAIAAGAGAAALPTRYVRVTLKEASRPLAPAALAYLTHPASLDTFFVKGECFLLSLEGVAWVATRPTVQGLVSLDLTNRCIVVDGGDTWLDAAPSTTLHLDILCASEAAATQVRATTAELLAQLVWQPERDGEDAAALKDPLPAWNE